LFASTTQLQEESINVNKSSSNEDKSDKAIVYLNTNDQVNKNDQLEHNKINIMRNHINSIQSFLKLE
jgi:hypothetical protein